MGVPAFRQVTIARTHRALMDSFETVDSRILRDGYEGVEGFYASAFGQDGEGVDVEFGDCALEAGGHVGNSHECVGKRFDVGLRASSESLKKSASCDLVYHLAGVEPGYRAEAQGDVVQGFDKYTAQAIEQDRAKLGIVARADYDLYAIRDHFLDQEAFNLGVRSVCGDVVHYPVVGFSHRVCVGESDSERAALGLVEYVGRLDLEDDGESDVAGGFHRFVDVGSAAFLGGGYPPFFEDPLGLVLGERGAFGRSDASERGSLFGRHIGKHSKSGFGTAVAPVVVVVQLAHSGSEVLRAMEYGDAGILEQFESAGGSEFVSGIEEGNELVVPVSDV